MFELYMYEENIESLMLCWGDSSGNKVLVIKWKDLRIPKALGTVKLTTNSSASDARWEAEIGVPPRNHGPDTPAYTVMNQEEILYEKAEKKRVKISSDFQMPGEAPAYLQPNTHHTYSTQINNNNIRIINEKVDIQIHFLIYFVLWWGV